MSTTKAATLAAWQGSEGREIVVLGKRDISEATLDSRTLQVSHLARRFGWPPHRAALMASLAFGEVRA
jgi:electron transfer flavoprotein alpha/beta subunit